MLYYLFASDPDSLFFINIFRYLTFRSGAALLTALAIVIIVTPQSIVRLKRRQKGKSTVRRYLTEDHAHKQGTPSMGGTIIIFAILVSSMLWVDMSNPYVWLVFISLVAFGALGFIDDLAKLSNESVGLSFGVKLALQVFAGVFVGYLYVQIAPNDLGSVVAVPFFKNLMPDIGVVLFVCWAGFVVVASSNAVNITDGLDGLAIVPTIIVAGTFALISYVVGNNVYAQYLQIIYVPGAGELAIVCACIIGAGLGFLWFNALPAQIFMGDSGSLSLGAALATISLVAKHELILALAGGLFVLETISVIVQVISFRLTGKRVFAMAPLHHHFEKRGWAESTIVVRFWIIAFVLALVSLSTLKLR